MDRRQGGTTSDFLENLEENAVLDGDLLCLPTDVFLGGDPTLRHLNGQLFIRQIYIDLCDYIFKAALIGIEARPGVYPAKRFLVLGTSGIGKTVFTYYLLYRLMKLGKTIVWQPAGKFQRVLISPSRPIQFGNAHDFVAQICDETAWFIIDETAAPPVNAFTVCTCSPKKDLVHTFRKTADYCLYMPVWSLDEIRRAHALGLGCSRRTGEEVPLDEAEKRFDRFGGIPCYVFECDTIAKDRLEQQLIAECKSLKSAVIGRSIGKFATGTGYANDADCTYDTAVHIVANTETEAEFPSYVLQFASPSVADDLVRLVVDGHENDLLHFLSIIKRMTEYAIIHSQMFKAFVHILLARGGKFKVGKLRKDAVPTDVKTITLETSTVTRIKHLSELTVYDEKLYWKLIEPNISGIDSLMSPDMLFRIPVAAKHPVKRNATEEAAKTLRDLQKQSPSKSNSPCVMCLFFVVPEAEFNDPREQDLVDADDRVTSGIDGNDLCVEQYVLGLCLADP